MEFFLNVFTEFIFVIKRSRTCYKRLGCYYNARKTQMRNRIVELSPIHVSVIYQILWIHWIQRKFSAFRKTSNVFNFNQICRKNWILPMTKRSTFHYTPSFKSSVIKVKVLLFTKTAEQCVISQDSLSLKRRINLHDGNILTKSFSETREHTSGDVYHG